MTFITPAVTSSPLALTEVPVVLGSRRRKKLPRKPHLRDSTTMDLPTPVDPSTFSLMRDKGWDDSVSCWISVWPFSCNIQGDVLHVHVYSYIGDAHMHVHKCTHTHTHTHKHTHMHTHSFTNTHTHIQACTHAHMHTHTHRAMHTQTCAHTHTHTHRHT